ncbi:hypothetical protein PT285_00555 [Lactobacillus sp. ESL0791]|uniref:hypothetical protein n=1 Tax=Lactobacillus sp. ESL0791 TaxID=2983234 RepID=UPI0023F921F4|nr:hypothetical protein [Lactobacillus sp. ESL0791]MDF7637930.1 hypothetical protein [Lactobacillus sp. ESL0791]
MFKNTKNKASFLEFLQKQTLPNANEQAIIDMAITELMHKENEYRVRQNMIDELELLAVKMKLSKEGVKLLTKLSKPDADSDIAQTSTTWFH